MTGGVGNLGMEIPMHSGAIVAKDPCVGWTCVSCLQSTIFVDLGRLGGPRRCPNRWVAEVRA
jgi:hypothetical protein